MNLHRALSALARPARHTPTRSSTSASPSLAGIMPALILGLSLVLAACQPGAAGQDTGPLTITMYSADANPNWADMKDAVGQVITAKTGITLQPEFGYGDSEERIALMAASGDVPDLIYAKGESAALIEAGLLLDLTDLINEHAPNIKKVLGQQFGRARYSAEDPAIYFVPSLEAINQKVQECGIFNIQLDALRQQNYPKLQTLADYEQAIATYYQANPVINGQPAIPLSLVASDWRIMITVTNPAYLTTGAAEDGEWYIDMGTGQAMLHFKRPVEREYFRWLNHMNATGLLDPEAMIQKFDQYQTKITQGRVIAVIDADWDIGGAMSYLKSQNMYERLYGSFPIVLSPEYQQHTLQRTGFTGGWGGAISTKCQDPVRVIKFLDFLASDEGQILNNWGIEGTHYVIQDGKRVIPQAIQDAKTNDNANFVRSSGIGNYQLSTHYGDGNLDSGGSYYTTNFPVNNWAARTDLEREVLGKYGYRNWRDGFPQEDEFPLKPWGMAWSIPIPNDSDLAPFMEREQDVVKKYIPEAILAKPENFDQAYDRFLQELEKIEATRMEGLFTEIVQKRIKFWQE